MISSEYTHQQDQRADDHAGQQVSLAGQHSTPALFSTSPLAARISWKTDHTLIARSIDVLIVCKRDADRNNGSHSTTYSNQVYAKAAELLRSRYADFANVTERKLKDGLAEDLKVFGMLQLAREKARSMTPAVDDMSDMSDQDKNTIIRTVTTSSPGSKTYASLRARLDSVLTHGFQLEDKIIEYYNEIKKPHKAHRQVQPAPAMEMTGIQKSVSTSATVSRALPLDAPPSSNELSNSGLDASALDEALNNDTTNLLVYRDPDNETRRLQRANAWQDPLAEIQSKEPGKHHMANLSSSVSAAPHEISKRTQHPKPKVYTLATKTAEEAFIILRDRTGHLSKRIQARCLYKVCSNPNETTAFLCFAKYGNELLDEYIDELAEKAV